MTTTPGTGADVQHAHAELLLKVTRRLDQAGIEWCLLSACPLGDEDVGVATTSGVSQERIGLQLAMLQRRFDPDDIDIVVRPTQFHEIHRVLAGITGADVVQHRRYRPTSIRYDVVWFAPTGVLAVLGVDVASVVREIGAVVMDAGEFLDYRERVGDVFWIPAASVRFAFCLLKRIRKSAELGGGALTPVYGAALSRLYRRDAEGCHRQLARFFPPSAVRQIVNAARSGQWGPVRHRLSALRAGLLGTAGSASPWQALRACLSDLARRLHRVRQPTGLVVAVLGADGAGKTSVIERVREELQEIFSASQCYHVRPRYWWSGYEDTCVRGPRAGPRRGPFVSLAKLAVWWVDYWAGFVFDIFPRIVKSTLVVFDRYYYDLLVSPERYRYGGPLWPVHALVPTLPRPHVTILLDAPAALTDGRRMDGEFHAPEGQRENYIAFVQRLPGGHVVDASRPLAEVVTQVERVVLHYLRARTTRRLGG